MTSPSSTKAEVAAALGWNLPPVAPQVTMAMVEAAIQAWNKAEPGFQIQGVSYHRTFAEVITAALRATENEQEPRS